MPIAADVALIHGKHGVHVDEHLIVGGLLGLLLGCKATFMLAVSGHAKRIVFNRFVFTRHRLQFFRSLLQYIST